MNFKPYISIFKNVFESNCKTVELSYFLDGNKWKELVEWVRAAKTPEEKAHRKQRVPAATISGIFTGKNDSNLVEHSGLICIDIDKKDNLHIEDFPGLKRKLGSLTFVAYAGQSISGIENGLFLLIPILNPNKHKEHFKALQYDLKKDFSINIDSACGNVSRLRYVTYEPDPIWNWQAIKYKRLIREQAKKEHVKTGRYNFNATTLDEFNTAYNVAQIIEQAGWVHLFNRGHWMHYNRPGAMHSNKTDAVVHRDKNFFYVYSESTAFEPNKCYSPFMTWATLEHSGDYSEALKKLRA